MVSSLMPRSSLMTLPPVRVAMSSSIALRRSPKPGALTAATFKRAAQLVDDEGREGFAFDIFSDDEQRTAHLGNLLEDRQQVAHDARSSFR